MPAEPEVAGLAGLLLMLLQGLKRIVRIAYLAAVRVIVNACLPNSQRRREWVELCREVVNC